MSHKQIAALLEISEKTIENQITKALKLIRKKIEENKDDQ
jgi:DNA-directed RNA polymerase specialized sigma24 family protein